MLGFLPLLVKVDIAVQGEKGMDDSGVFQPAGYRIKENFLYDKRWAIMTNLFNPIPMVHRFENQQKYNINAKKNNDYVLHGENHT